MEETSSRLILIALARMPKIKVLFYTLNVYFIYFTISCYNSSYILISIFIFNLINIAKKKFIVVIGIVQSYLAK